MVPTSRNHTRVSSVPNLRTVRRLSNHFQGSRPHVRSYSPPPAVLSAPHLNLPVPAGWQEGPFSASSNARISSPLSEPFEGGEAFTQREPPPVPGPDVIDSVWFDSPPAETVRTPDYSDEMERFGPVFPTSPVLSLDSAGSASDKVVNLGFPRLSSLSLQSSTSPPDMTVSPRSVPDSPPKTRSNIALPPRSGYSLSDDSDSLRSEGDTSAGSGPSSNESSSENEGDSALDDDDDDSNEQRIRKWQLVRSSAVPTLPDATIQRAGLVPDSTMYADVSTNGTRHRTSDSEEEDTSNDADAEDEREERSVKKTAALLAPLSGATAPEVSTAGNAPISATAPAVEEDLIDTTVDPDETTEFLDDGLSCLERIFLFAKSDLAYHRVLVSRCLADWIKDVDLTDAVEYIIPLLNGLATDELEVSAVFAPELGRLMWFFFRNCPLQELSDLEPSTDDTDEEIMPRPCITVSTFTPLLCSLLLNPNNAVSGATQASIVEYFLRSKHYDEALRQKDDGSHNTADDVRHADLVEMGMARDKLVPLTPYNFGREAREAVLNELFEHVAIAISCMDDSTPEPSASTAAASSAIPAPTTDKAESGAGATPYERLPFDEESALGRMMSVNLLAAITVEGGFSREQLTCRVVPEITSWPCDPAFFVRKEVAAAIGIIGKALMVEEDDGFLLGETNAPVRLFEAINRVLLDHVWQVRQAACYSLPGVFAIQPHNQARRENLVLIMRALKQDVSPNVQLAAFEMIGEVIYLFHDDDAGVPDELVRMFMGLPIDATHAVDTGNGTTSDTEAHRDLLSNSDYSLIIAFNFPAVILTMGAQHWPKLRPLYMQLTQHAYDNVRNSLAASLHEIARLLGSEMAATDLVPAADRFLHDSCLDVTATLLEHMDEFWLLLPPHIAREQLRRIPALWLDAYSQEWHLRQSLATHIPSLVPTLLLTDEDGCLVTLLLLALNDSVNAIRAIGVHAVPIIYHTFRLHDETIADGFLSMLCDFAYAPSSRQRSTFLHIARVLLEEELGRDRFEHLVLPCLLKLAGDCVMDVRIALVRTFQQIWSRHWYTSQNMPHSLLRVAATLLACRVRVVQDIMRSLEPPLQDVKVSEAVPPDERLPLEFGPARPLLDQTTIPWRNIDECEQSDGASV